MPRELEETSSSVLLRPDWLDSVALQLQIAIGRVSSEEVDEAHATVEAFAGTLPAPESYVERLLLRGLILEFACRCGEAAHARAHGETATSCDFTPAGLLQSLWDRPSDDARHALVHWADVFFEELKERHTPSLASRVARWIRKDYTRPFNLTDLADHFHATPSQLQRAFKREFGVSMREYQRNVRLKAALAHVGTQKMDARAFHKLTGQTPTAYRAQLMSQASNDSSAKNKK